MGKVYGPTIRHWWFYRWFVSTHQDDFGWTAILRYGGFRAQFGGSSGALSVSGCDTREEAIESLKHSATMRVTQDDETGKWVEA